jgi:hypothetical protein
LDCTVFGNKIKNGASAFVSAAVAAISAGNPNKTAVVELVLTGTLNLNRIALDQAMASLEIADQAGVFAVSIDTTRLNIGTGFGAGAETGADMLPRDELERRAIFQLVGQQPLWGLQESQQSFADLFFELKESVRTSEAGEVMASRIAASQLVEKVRLAMATPVLPASTPGEQVTQTLEVA